MSDRDASSDAFVPTAESESGLAHLDAHGEGSDTIELAFTGTELNAFLADPAMQGDLSGLLAQQTDAALAGPSSAAVEAETVAPASSQDDLLAALRDDMIHGEGEDVLEAAVRIHMTMEGGGDTTFLLTQIDIGDLVGDFDQAWDPGLGSEAEFLDQFIDPPVALPPGGPGPVMIEIEDDLGVAAAHILT